MQNDYLGNNLIFVISQPRSGSTLLQRMLAGHPDIHATAETWLMLHPVYGTRSTGLKTEFNSGFASHAVNEFLANYADGQATYDRGIRAFARSIYGEALERSGRRLFLDKTPRYFFIIPELKRLFPEARFIFLLRNPMAVLQSELRTYVKGDWPVLAKFAPGLLVAPRRIVDGIELLGGQAIVMRYEDMVTDPESQVAGLCEQLGIGLVDGMIDYGNTPAPKGSANDPVGIHRHSRPSTENLKKWRKLADDPQERLFARHYLAALGPELLAELGYSHDEIAGVIGGDPAAVRDGRLFPWRIAIKEQEKWSMRDRYLVERYFAVAGKGWLGGSLDAGARFAGRLLKAIVR